MAQMALVVVDLHQQGQDWVLMWINAQKRHWVPAVGALPPWRTCFMLVLNSDIARNLDKHADLLQLEGANPFRIRVYWGAARVVAEPRRSVIAMTAAGEDPTLPGIGRDLSEQIGAVAASGHITVLDETERRTPVGLLALLDVPGVGARTEQRTRQEAQKRAATAPRIKRPIAEDIAKPLLRYVGEIEGIQPPPSMPAIAAARKLLAILTLSSRRRGVPEWRAFRPLRRRCANPPARADPVIGGPAQ